MASNLRSSIIEVVAATAPLTLAVALLSALFLGFSITSMIQLLIGALFATVGLFLFLAGSRTALVPMGEQIGAYLPKRGSIAFLAVAAFIFSFSVTIADPSVHVLVTQVASFPYSGIRAGPLSLLIACGAGIFVTVALLRIVLNVPIRRIFVAAYTLAIALSFFTSRDLTPLFFDSGSVATGPMAVPCVIALGLGTASVLQRRQTLADEFGLVGLATLGPVLALMAWGVILR